MRVNQKLDDTYTAPTDFHQAQSYSSDTHLATKDYWTPQYIVYKLHSFTLSCTNSAVADSTGGKVHNSCLD